MKIIESIHALEKTNEPVRIHKIRPCHLKQLEKRINWKGGKGKIFLYHDRIQKKWIKRFGYVMKPCIFEMPGGIFVVHPALMAKMGKIMGDIINKAQSDAFIYGKI